MDPMADKFLTACTLIMLQELGRISAVVVMLLICRELAITGLRALASAEGVIIAASNSGKWKTGTQMVAIGFLIAQSIFGIPLNLAGLILLYISLAISLWSAQDYVVGFFKGVREARRTKSHERKIARQARMAARSARMANKAKRQPL
jgi:CDP-diacylglycerol--glycerol-3-phosphate 3-phosphatidyltransferase